MSGIDYTELEPLFVGATFYGDEYEIYEVVDDVEVPVDLTGADAKMEFRDKYDKLIETFSTEDDTLQVLDNKVILPEQELKMVAGVYFSDISLVLANGDIVPGLMKLKWTFTNPVTKR